MLLRRLHGVMAEGRSLSPTSDQRPENGGSDGAMVRLRPCSNPLAHLLIFRVDVPSMDIRASEMIDIWLGQLNE